MLRAHHKLRPCAQQLWPVLTPLSFPDAATRSWRLLETCIECRSIRRLPSCRLLPVGSRSGTGETLRLPLYHEELAFTAHCSVSETP